MRSMLIGAGALALGGAVLAPAAADPAITHEASPADGGYADVVVTTGAELAGEWLSVLVIDEDADADAPATADIVFVEQRQLDDDGGLAFRVQLPSGELGGYDIALNTTGGTERYLAPLDGVEDPGPEPEPTDEPTDGPTEEPTDGPTAGPGDGPDGEPTDEPTGGPTDGPTDGPTAPGDGDDDGAGGAGADGSGDGSDGGGSGADGSGAGGADSAGDDSGGQLSQTGAPVALAVVVALAAIAGGVLLKVRRSRA
ncbi:PT domain-containing protein [Georgenia sp. MJ170]|uniref:PT domain-containing protein n=1 Tax=Georgenia sunbinii TaxID=3117728 RepID=UPI002F26719E